MDKHQEFKSKSKYKISNWAEYNKGLKSRGNITVWLSEEAIKAWEYTGKREKGGKIDYSDLAIETCLTIKQVMRLKLRQTEGFIESLLSFSLVQNYAL